MNDWVSLFNMWVSGFITYGAVVNITLGRLGWAFAGFALAALNVYLAFLSLHSFLRLDPVHCPEHDSCGRGNRRPSMQADGRTSRGLQREVWLQRLAGAGLGLGLRRAHPPRHRQGERLGQGPARAPRPRSPNPTARNPLEAWLVLQLRAVGANRGGARKWGLSHGRTPSCIGCSMRTGYAPQDLRGHPIQDLGQSVVLLEPAIVERRPATEREGRPRAMDSRPTRHSLNSRAVVRDGGPWCRHGVSTAVQATFLDRGPLARGVAMVEDSGRHEARASTDQVPHPGVLRRGAGAAHGL